MRCGFCGHEFDPAEAEMGCLGCPVTKGCHLVRCPRCGYEMPPEAKLVGWLRRLKAGREAKQGSALSDARGGSVTNSQIE